MGKTKTYLPQIKHYYAEDEPVHEMREWDGDGGTGTGTATEAGHLRAAAGGDHTLHTHTHTHTCTGRAHVDRSKSRR